MQKWFCNRKPNEKYIAGWRIAKTAMLCAIQLHVIEMYVLKKDGRKDIFNKAKIIATCMRAGAAEKTASAIADKIASSISDGTSTHAIYRMVLDELEKRSGASKFLFQLRDAIANLDSQSYEIYAKKLLESHGYACEWNKIIEGNSVEHQVDIVAKSRPGASHSGLFLVECKKHFNPHRFCGLGTILQVQARLEDIIDGFAAGRNSYNFTQAWVFNNTKFSEHAKRYAEKKNILLTGWRYKDKLSIESMSQKTKTFPITILNPDISDQVKLLQQGIITCNDLLTKSARISAKSLKELRARAKALM